MKDHGWDPWHWPWDGNRPVLVAPTPIVQKQPQARRSRKRTLGLVELHRRDRGTCHLCGGYCPIDQATRDRLVPGFLGGDYYPENLALAHKECNRRRGHDPLSRYPRGFGYRILLPEHVVVIASFHLEESPFLDVDDGLKALARFQLWRGSTFYRPTEGP